MKGRTILNRRISMLAASFVCCATLGRAEERSPMAKTGAFLSTQGLTLMSAEIRSPRGVPVRRRERSPETHIFRIGENVITADGVSGRIDGYGPGGLVHVHRNRGSNVFEYASALSRTEGCGYGFCVGYPIVTSDG